MSIDELTSKVSTANPSALFDLSLANDLYQTLLSPVESLIKRKHQLLVVPSGPLTSLPLHLLVTEKPAVAVSDLTDLKLYRDAAWLLKRHAVSVLPAVASLKALRESEHRNPSAKPLVGFASPSFQPGKTSQPAGSRTFVAATRSYSDFWAGAEINRDALAEGLVALPATADELEAVATLEHRQATCSSAKGRARPW